ncbi:hypothetical protein J6590_071404 [Homalodisca vitripennis]|nr:hypothetical protein J6590_071404 [Homalodisca vitripennis]
MNPPGEFEQRDHTETFQTARRQCTLQTVPELVDISLPASRQTIDVSIVLAELHQHVILGAIKMTIVSDKTQRHVSVSRSGRGGARFVLFRLTKFRRKLLHVEEFHIMCFDKVMTNTNVDYEKKSAQAFTTRR